MIATPVSAEFLTAFQARAGGGDILRFDHFVELALYHPTLGYYRRHRLRVGRDGRADFFTASSTAAFRELLVAAAVSRLAGESPKAYTWVEIGAESAEGALHGLEHPFGQVRTVRAADALHLAGRCIVFSNELFDAQPFRRFAFRRGAWRELGVRASAAGIAEVELDSELPPMLPPAAPEGYRIDAPFAAAGLLESIASADWTGLFLAFDYGRTWNQLVHDVPAGTARAYAHHRQSTELLANPGEQDLTCDVCWDWLQDTLRRHNFASPTVQSQESFFVAHAAAYLDRALSEDAARFSARKQSILQLIHPLHMGRQFQVLHAKRDNPRAS